MAWLYDSDTFSRVQLDAKYVLPGFILKVLGGVGKWLDYFGLKSNKAFQTGSRQVAEQNTLSVVVKWIEVSRKLFRYVRRKIDYTALAAYDSNNESDSKDLETPAKK